MKRNKLCPQMVFLIKNFSRVPHRKLNFSTFVAKNNGLLIKLKKKFCCRRKFLTGIMHHFEFTRMFNTSKNTIMEEQNESVRIFRDYLKIKTVQPNPDYDGAVNFLRVYAKEVDLEFGNVEPYPGNPFAWMTWRGTSSSLPSVLLYSHMDVVPVYQERWKHDPFGAHKDPEGNIYGRGTQDMKSIGIQYVEAIRKLKQSGLNQCLRDIHVIFAPDEELGGSHGMEKFVQHDAFKQMNVGVMIDEGITTEDNIYRIYYGERVNTPLLVTCTGNAGHSSQIIENTATEKVQWINLSQGYMTATRIFTMIKNNTGILPPRTHSICVWMYYSPSSNFDIRAPPTTDFEKLKNVIDHLIKQAGPGVSYKLDLSKAFCNITDLNAATLWWTAIQKCFTDLGVRYRKEIFPAGTDSKYLRKLGYPSFGFSPIINTPVLLHDHNEFLNEATFLEGIRIYTKLIPALANAQ